MCCWWNLWKSCTLNRCFYTDLSVHVSGLIKYWLELEHNLMYNMLKIVANFSWQKEKDSKSPGKRSLKYRLVSHITYCYLCVVKCTCKMWRFFVFFCCIIVLSCKTNEDKRRSISCFCKIYRCVFLQDLQEVLQGSLARKLGSLYSANEHSAVGDFQNYN